MAAESIARRFARWGAGVSAGDLPAEVVDKAKAALLFHLVAGALGATTPRAARIAALVAAEEPGAAGATVLGTDARVTRGAASFASCAAIEASGMFDSFRMLTHPGPALVAVALANAELENASGEDLLVALACGYELSCRLAEEFVPSVAAHAFRPAPIFATLGAAMTAGRLMALGEEQLLAAIALAASSASGLNEPARSGGEEMRFHEPSAARHGCDAATLARAVPFRGSEHAIEGEAGFLRAFAGSRAGSLSFSFDGRRLADVGAIASELGVRWQMLDLMFRVYATAGFNQPVVELMAELVREHGVVAADVERVAVTMNSLETLYPSPAFPRSDPGEARPGSTQHLVAHVAIHGGLAPVGAEPLGEGGPDGSEWAMELARRVELVAVDGHPMLSPEIEIVLRDGRAIRGAHPYARLAWGFSEVADRLRVCAPAMAGGAERLEETTALVAGVERLDTVAVLLEAARERGTRQA